MSLSAFISSLLVKVGESRGVMGWALFGAGVGATIVLVFSPGGVAALTGAAAGTAVGGGARAVAGDVARQVDKAWQRSKSYRSSRRQEINNKKAISEALRSARRVIKLSKKTCSDFRKLAASQSNEAGHNAKPVISGLSLKLKHLENEIKNYQASPDLERLRKLINSKEELMINLQEAQDSVSILSP